MVASEIIGALRDLVDKISKDTEVSATNQTASAPTQETFSFDYQLEREPFTGVAYEYVITMATTGTNQDIYASIEWQEIT